MPDPILTIGDLEPERPTVVVNRNAPDGWWQRFKHRHLDLLLRWFPVRYTWTSVAYPLRLRSEFGVRSQQRLQRMAFEADALSGRTDRASAERLIEIVGAFCKMVLVAPPDVVDSLDLDQRIRLVLAFQQTAMGKTPTRPRPENPPTSELSSPASTVSTAPGTG